MTWADGTTTREAWRLVTSLLDHTRYPADELVTLYHRRWQAETTYLSIKSTILDGRVLRSQRPADIDQEVYALLTVYQAIIRMSVDAVDTCPGAALAPGPTGSASRSPCKQPATRSSPPSGSSPRLGQDRPWTFIGIASVIVL